MLFPQILINVLASQRLILASILVVIPKYFSEAQSYNLIVLK